MYIVFHFICMYVQYMQSTDKPALNSGTQLGELIVCGARGPRLQRAPGNQLKLKTIMLAAVDRKSCNSQLGVDR